MKADSYSNIALPQNNFCFIGKVDSECIVGITKYNEEMCKFILSVKDKKEGKINPIPIICRGECARKIIPYCNRGNILSVSGYVSTKLRRINGENTASIYFVVTDSNLLSKLDDNNILDKNDLKAINKLYGD